jgi:hypothetical protein
VAVVVPVVVGDAGLLEIQSVFQTMAFTERRLCMGPWKQVSR